MIRTASGSSKFYIEVTKTPAGLDKSPLPWMSDPGGELDPDKDLEIRVMDMVFTGEVDKESNMRPVIPEAKRTKHNSLSFHAMATEHIGDTMAELLSFRVTIKRRGDLEDIDYVDRREPNPYIRPVQLGIKDSPGHPQDPDPLPVAGEKIGGGDSRVSPPTAYTGDLFVRKEKSKGGGEEVADITEFPEKYSEYD